MIKATVINQFSDLIMNCEKNIIGKILDGRLETEPDITNRFLQSIEDTFENGKNIDDVKFLARTLKDRGSDSAERKFGADICGILDINIQGYQITKGFLIQAKYDRQLSIIKNGAIHFTSSKNSEIYRQSQDMLNITYESYIMIYNKLGFKICKADNIGQKIIEGDSVNLFFTDLLSCKRGDRDLVSHSNEMLEKLKQRTKSHNGLEIFVNK